MSNVHPVALIADDEPLLREALEKELSIAWPELTISDRTGDGATTIERLLSSQHDIAFLDIKMPLVNGIDVMKVVTEDWPEGACDTKQPPLFVFVTAYDDFAIEAFELAAIDYIVKPVSAERLAKTVERLKLRWGTRNSGKQMNQLVSQINKYTAQEHKTLTNVTWLNSVRAGVGDTVYLIPINDIIMFEASDKYVVVHTENQQTLIRETLRSLLPRLNPEQFRQVHRSAIVNLDYVIAANRIDGTKMTLSLKGCEESPAVSRLYRHLFKAM